MTVLKDIFIMVAWSLFAAVCGGVAFFFSMHLIDKVSPEWRDLASLAAVVLLFLLAGVPLIAALVVAYVSPSIVAVRYKHPQSQAVAALNVLLGWTLIGWVLSLVWALTAAGPIGASPPALEGGEHTSLKSP